MTEFPEDSASIDTAPISREREGRGGQREKYDGGHLACHERAAFAFEEHAASRLYKMREWQRLPDTPCPGWHSQERKHEAREQHGRQLEKDGALDRLQLAFSESREGEPQNEMGGGIERHGREQSPQVSCDR